MENIEKQIEIMSKDIERTGMLDSFSRCEIVAKDLYDEGYRKQSEWISVEERLSAMYEDVLCYDGRLIHVDFICSDGKWCEEKFHKVTHWMPLPEAPKGGAE